MAVDVEVSCLMGSKSIDDGFQGVTDIFQAVQTVFEVQVGQVIADNFQAEEGAPFFVLFDKGVFPIGAKDMAPVVDSFQDGLEFAFGFTGDAMAENLSDPISGEAIEA